nr:hypothetical protein [Tanacetum cinerariifolium]
MTDVHTTQEFEVTHVTLTPVNPDGQQQSLSVSSQFVTSVLNPSPAAGIDSLFEKTPQMNVPAMTTVASLTLSTPTLPPPTIPTSSLEPSLIKVAVQIQSDRLQDEAQAENEAFFKNLDENIQKIIKEQVKEQVKVQVSKILPKIEKTVNEKLEAEVLTQSSNSSKTSYVVAADLSEMELKKILIKKMESNKYIHRSDEQRNLCKALVEAYESDKIILDTYGDTVTLKRRHDDADKDEEPFVGSDQGSKRRREGKIQSQQALQRRKQPRPVASLHKGLNLNKILQVSLHQQRSQCIQLKIWKSPHIKSLKQVLLMINLLLMIVLRTRLCQLLTEAFNHTLTPELLAGPTYQLMKGSCKSLMELEFFLEEVYKATTYQLDWNNPEGQQYPHNLLKPLSLIPNFRGRRVIPFDHFTENDLEYLRGGPTSRKYTTSVTKTKAADYGHIKWIEDLVPRIMWSQEPIVEWHNYKHLDWITVHRDDDKLYKFKEEDLQLRFKSYQKKLNLTKPDTYRSDLKRKEAYTAYSNPRGFIYQNKDKQNRLMRIDELHKFRDGTLNDVRTALDDRLKEGSTQGYPLASVEVLRYDKRSKSENMRIVPTEMELILEHTQQGISHEVSFKEITIPANKETGRAEETCLQTLADLTPEEKTRMRCDIKAANIILQRIPNDIYVLLNHNKKAYAIWYRVKELMEGIELTKQERESKLTDEFDRFTFEKGEMIQSYYLIFAKMMNDINIINMKMTRL